MTRIRRYTGARRGAILDVGCAYGPFLAAAADAGWDAYGIDVSERAVAYVRDTLGFPAVPSSLEDFDPEGAFGVREFDAVTLWFVLEHLPDAGAALKKIRSLLKPGGLLAFSTPSASGVSARTNPQGFYGSSPRDHVTLWEPERARPILSSLGFDVLKIVSTGHHPERFPRMERASGDSLAFKALGLWSRVRSLGDTFEAYCVAGISNGGFSSKNQL
ncbi:MAG: class I SAM-dependent methyltransferase [Spirochaetaceae bacterium]|nr:class I SAM-dependent methyltransferase [Spirochaetaceae bacterium]